ncbi:DUF423 domain-containing protein [Ancylobacter radicis]|uniref:DUF423 domain-containing protein n=1 Tax=Ancylobacter radicis TaxID=2836179 RepID=A0ABS5RCD8_9HYPH|nr:DUF423 domain-containing protein [Ancylobacter radicis]MBS9478499.1 DUF423 domain-containing protein [Ancylobacter radicis]
MNLFRRLIVLIAGLMGGAGVAAAAAGAHMNPDPNLTTAAYFLMLGAAGAIAVAALATAQGPAFSIADAGAGLVGFGALLFGGTLALRSLWNIVIFPMAAPTGGTMLILGWVVVALAAFRRGNRAG